MEGLDAGLAATTNAAPVASPSAEPAQSTADKPQTLDGIFDQTLSELSAGETAPPPPVASTPEATTPAPATTEPPTDQTAAEPAPGPIPLDRHKAILENARTEAAKEAETKFQQQYANELQFVQAWRADPIGAFRQMFAEMRANPQLRPYLASMVGSELAASRRAAQQPQADAEPEADLQLQDGTLVYSAPQQKAWQQWHAKQLRQEMTKELAPAMQIAQREQFRQQQEQAVSMAMDGYKPYVEELKAMPGFSDHAKEIVARQQALFKEVGGRADPMTLLFRAYREIVPAKQQAQQQQQLAQTQQSLVQQAGVKLAAAAHNPAASAPAQPRKPRTVDEAFDQAMAEVGWR
jgi:hypothetical protein